MNNKQIAREKLNSFLGKTSGMSLLDFPDSEVFEDWIEDDMTEKQIDSIIPDLAWEVLDNSGIDRDLVDNICYPEEYEEEGY